MERLKKALKLFLLMFKIGLITFGGGYAMIAILDRELVEKKKYLSEEEFLDVVAIAESSPGPIAVNSATYIGYKQAGILGAFFSTLGVVLPSFIIIYIISLFFEQFLALEYVGYAFSGIQVCVAFLILSAGIKMAKKLQKNFLSLFLLILTILAMLTLTFFSKNVSAIFYILIGGVVGLTVYLICYIKDKAKKKDEKVEEEEK